MDEYNELEDIFFGKIKLDNEAKIVKTKGLYQYVNLLKPPKNPSQHVSYRLLIEICKIFKEDRIQHVTKKLLDYGTIKNVDPQIEELIVLAGNFADDFDTQQKIEINLDNTIKKALKEIADFLSAENEQQDIQNSIYQISKANNIEPKDLFKTLYQIILSTDRGPRIGPFINDIGRKKIAQTLYSYVQ